MGILVCLFYTVIAVDHHTPGKKNYKLFTALTQLNSKKVERVKKTPLHINEKKAFKFTGLYSSPPLPSF